MGKPPPGWKTLFLFEYITGGGLAGQDLPESLAAEGLAMRRALARDFASVPGIHVLVAADPRIAKERGPWTTVRWEVDRATDRSLNDLVRQADLRLIIAPETGGLLERLQESPSFGCGASLGSDVAAIRIAGDKVSTARVLDRAGVPTPATRELRHAESPPGGIREHLRYPLVRKPIDGAGSIDTVILNATGDSTDVDESTLAGSIVQPFLPLVVLSATFLIGRDNQTCLVAVARQMIDVVGGRVAYRGGVVPSEYWPGEGTLRKAIWAMEGLRGCIGIDFLFDPITGESSILEINPRPTTSIVGILALLPPGLLARAWLDSLEPANPGSDILMCEMIRAQPPLRFDADGTPSRR